MIWTVIIVIIVLILFSFLKDVNKDNSDLVGENLNEKFPVIVNMINQSAYNGLGQINHIDKREFNLYKTGENQIIHFFYGTGHLTITWKYKYYQKEIEHKKVFNNVRNISTLEQEKIGKTMVDEMEQIVAKHQNEVLKNLSL